MYLQLCGFCLERCPLPLGAWDGLRYFIAFHIIILFISRFGFKSGIWFLIAPVPVHCFSITFMTVANFGFSSCLSDNPFSLLCSMKYVHNMYFI